jgi:hypothetical protein
VRWERVALVAAPLALVAIVIGHSVFSSGSAPGPAAGAGAPELYGVNLALPPGRADARVMASGGVSTARFPFDWRAVQSAKGAGYDWGQLDQVVGNLARDRVTTLPILYGTPYWISPNYARPPIQNRAAIRGWQRLLTAEVHRYGPGGTFWRAHRGLPYEPIRYWQVWNEPNLPEFFAPRADPRKYTRLLRISAAALRKANPHVKVVLAGLPRTGGKKGQMLAWKFLNALYNDGAKGDFDVLAIHPFWSTVRGVTSQIERLRAVTRRHGQGSLPMWITEVGWSSARSKQIPLDVGPDRQAALLRSTFSWIEAHRESLHLDRTFWVLWRDTAAVRGATCNFCQAGLVSRDLKSKPAWQAYQSFAAGRAR